MTHKVYIVAQNIAEARAIGGMVMPFGATYQGFNSAASCIAALNDSKLSKPSLLIVDEKLTGLGGVELVKLCEMGHLNIPSLILVDNDRFEQALDAVSVAHADFVIKPVTEKRLHRSMREILEKTSLSTEVRRLKCQLNEGVAFPNIVGRSKSILSLLSLVERCAHSDMTVLIQGESGVGKEVIAQSLHQLSPRCKGPMVSINCGAIPENLMESELFGHKKGSFTGAVQEKEGQFQTAEGGTLFLDEISELSLTMQVKLLRALQEGEVMPVGATSPVKVNVRLVTATNKHLATCVAEGTFREDLFYRLNVLPLDVPPLRNRGTDVILLAQHFLKKYALKNQTENFSLSESAKQFLLSLDWPGNVRQLENAVYRAAVLSDSQVLSKGDFQFMTNEGIAAAMTAQNSTQWPTLEDMEQQYVGKVVALCDGNLSEAARILGISRSTLYRKLPEHEQIKKPYIVS